MTDGGPSWPTNQRSRFPPSRVSADTQRVKESPGGEDGAPKEKTSRGTPRYYPKAQIRQGGDAETPDPPRLGKAGRDLPRRTGDGARHDQAQRQRSMSEHER